MKQSKEVTVVLTSCNRPDLLEKTLDSFFKYNTYPITTFNIIDDSGVVGLYATKGDAVKAARAHTERTQESTSIDVVKVLEKGNTKVAKVTYKKSSTERDGRWIFFGWASY